MGVYDGVVKIITKAMARMQGAAQPVYLRTITDAGGDKVLGTRGTPSTTDVLVTPPPFVWNVSYREIAASGGKLFDGDYALLMPPSYTPAQIWASYAVINGEACKPVKIDVFPVEGKPAWMKVLYTRKRTVGQQL